MEGARKTRRLLAGLLTIALALAASTIALGVVASRALRERESAVREGVLLRLSQNLEQELRAGGPDRVDAILGDFLRAHSTELESVQLRARSRVVATAGAGGVGAVSVSLALGPSWRFLGGMGGGYGQQGRPPFELVLNARPELGSTRTVATAVAIGSVVAGLCLFVFAALAAASLAQRERVVLAEEERKRLETTALAGAGLAHRIRNPLATIKGTAQLLEEQLGDGARERATRIVDAAGRIELLVDDLLRFARPVEAHPERLDLSAIATSLAARTSGVKMKGDEGVFAFADREHVESAVEELVSNARSFDAGVIELDVQRRGDRALVEIKDRGPGLQIGTPEAFQPYVTTRSDGTGLGLPTIAALMHANGGEVRLSSRPGGGTVATLVLAVPKEES